MFINVVITLECLGHVLHTHIQTYTDTVLHTYIHTLTLYYTHTYIHTYIHTYTDTVLHTYIHTLTLHDCLSKYQVVKGHLWDEKIKIIQSK
jgi:hypothetical protein